MKPKIVSSEIAHQNPYYRVRHDKLMWNETTPGDYFVIELPPCVVVIAVQDDTLLIVEQYRHPIEEMTIEFPMGSSHRGETIEAAARRELEEETGYAAEELRQIGKMYPVNGVANIEMNIFLATKLTAMPKQHLDVSEEGLTRRWIPIAEWEESIRNGTITDGDSLAAWAIYRAWQERTN